MRVHVLGSEDLVLGFRLAGIGGDVVADDRTAVRLFGTTAHDPEVALIVVSGRVAAAAQAEIAAVRTHAGFPIVVEVADADEPGRDPESLMRFVREAVGLRL